MRRFCGYRGLRGRISQKALTARGRNGAVATEVKVCSDVGIQVLKEGGNAIDAAIASCLCVGSVNSFASGIGGGGFLVFRPGNTTQQHPVAIDFRETAPTGSHPDMYKDDTLSSVWGGKAVGVPGELRGLEAAFNLHGSGKISWARLFEPSIRLAESHKAGKELAKRLTVPVSSRCILLEILIDWHLRSSSPTSSKTTSYGVRYS